MRTLPKPLTDLIDDLQVHTITFARLGSYFRFVYAIETGVICVRHGDTLSDIAQFTGTDWHELARLNNLENAHLIFPEQILKLR